MTAKGRSEPEAYGWWLAALLGAVLGVFLGVTIGVLPQLSLPASSSDWAAWVQAGGTIAAIVAAAALALLQMRYAANKEDQRYSRHVEARSRSAFITLPNDLSQMTDYVIKCVGFVLANSEGEIVSRNTPIHAEDIPCLDGGIFQRLREDIPFISGSAADCLSELMSWYQVQHSRMSGLTNRDMIHRAYDYVFDAVKLLIMVNAIFDFARNRGRCEIQTIYDQTSVSNAILNAIPIRERHRDAIVEKMTGRFAGRVGQPIFLPAAASVSETSE